MYVNRYIISSMTTAEFRKNMKKVFDQVDTGTPVLITRGGSVYTIIKEA